MTVRRGRHFLQIPGPSNTPDRILRAMDAAVMDHRGPDFADLAHACLDGMKRPNARAQPVVHTLLPPVAVPVHRLGVGPRLYT